uniref:DUF4220 domain-containing protein n=1 Tax=Leersia perrieri TaxID=77586 RepID=A0A0D9XUU1_9ORYZ
MIYDYLYTKFDGGLKGMLCRLATISLTCIALTLFVVSRLYQKGRSNYDRADVTISYILLVGGIILEISSVFLWRLVLPCGAGTLAYNIMKHVHLESRVEWSGQLQQYNMIDWCIQERRAGRLKRMMSCMGIERGCTKPVKVSREIKKVLLVKMLEIWFNRTGLDDQLLDLSRFHGQWAQWWVKHYYSSQTASVRDELQPPSPPSPSSKSSVAQRALDISHIQDVGFVTSAFLWHLVTNICLDADSTSVDETSSKLRSSCQELSNYVMYLIVECEAMLGPLEHDLVKYRKDQMKRFVNHKYGPTGSVDRLFIQEIGKTDVHDGRENLYSKALLQMEAAPESTALVDDHWDLIAMVWTQMICYIAKNCGASLHAKQLCPGGEFVTHVFLLFSAIFRKSHRSAVLSVLLWLAYLSADSVAIFILGRLTLLVGDDPRHQLVLFWAPFLLLHLGGQETITAFSMEDCALWKRHLLNLATQLSLAIYVVSKQWRGDKQLVAPTILMFISGTTKYAERILALRRVQSRALESSSMEFHVSGADIQFSTNSRPYYEKLGSIISHKQEKNFERVMEVATQGFRLSLYFLMDLTLPRPSFRYNLGKDLSNRPLNNLGDMAYKLAEVHLSLIYDYLYTKFGSLTGVFCRLTTLVLTCTAFAMFVSIHGSRSQAWTVTQVRCCTTSSSISVQKAEWSGQGSYNSITWSTGEKSWIWLERTIRCVGIERACTSPVALSENLKKVLLDKMLQVWATSTSADDMDLTKFHGRWAQRWVLGFKRHHQVQRDVAIDDHQQAETAPSSEVITDDDQHQMAPSSEFDIAQRALEISDIQGMDFESSAFLWHLVTDICLVADADKISSIDSEFKTSCQELSNYIIYLVIKCKAMLSRNGRQALNYDRQQMMLHLWQESVDRKGFIQKLHSIKCIGSPSNVFVQAHCVSLELLKMEETAHRWELIATVWVEMICYIAHNCGAGFHAKQLCAGGEFVTHVKIILFILSFPF